LNRVSICVTNVVIGPDELLKNLKLFAYVAAFLNINRILVCLVVI